MHTKCEIIIPPNSDIKSSVETVLKPYDENNEPDEDGYKSPHEFWDFWVIGGRFSGDKFIQLLDQSKVSEFYEWMNSEGVTVSGLQCGKQEINPPDQISKVDEKWNSIFGTTGACPIFKHSNDQYDSDDNLNGDAMNLVDCKPVTCGRVIFTGPSFDGGTLNGPLETTFMLADRVWNGANHMPVKWDGTIGDALSQFSQRLENMSEEYRSVASPKDDWLVVTVDYHS